MTSHRITAQVQPWIDEAIEAHCPGEEVSWDAALMPGQNQEPTLILFFWFPSALLGQKQVGSVAINGDPSAIERDSLTASLADFFAQMRAARQDALSAAGPASAAPAPQAFQRGSQTASGLLIP